jgi:hypothetical protein
MTESTARCAFLHLPARPNAGRCRVLTVSTGADEQTPSNQQDHQQRAWGAPSRAGARAGDPLLERCCAHSAIGPDPWRLPKVTGERLRQKDEVEQIDSERVAVALDAPCAAHRTSGSGPCSRRRATSIAAERMIVVRPGDGGRRRATGGLSDARRAPSWSAAGRVVGAGGRCGVADRVMCRRHLGRGAAGML